MRHTLGMIGAARQPERQMTTQQARSRCTEETAQPQNLPPTPAAHRQRRAVQADG